MTGHNCQSTMGLLRNYVHVLEVLVHATHSYRPPHLGMGTGIRPVRGGRRCQGPPTVILYSVVHNHHGTFPRSSTANKKARPTFLSNHQSPQQQYLCFIIPASACTVGPLPSPDINFQLSYRILFNRYYSSLRKNETRTSDDIILT